MIRLLVETIELVDSFVGRDHELVDSFVGRDLELVDSFVGRVCW